MFKKAQPSSNEHENKKISCNLRIIPTDDKLTRTQSNTTRENVSESTSASPRAEDVNVSLRTNVSRGLGPNLQWSEKLSLSRRSSYPVEKINIDVTPRGSKLDFPSLDASNENLTVVKTVRHRSHSLQLEKSDVNFNVEDKLKARKRLTRYETVLSHYNLLKIPSMKKLLALTRKISPLHLNVVAHLRCQNT